MPISFSDYPDGETAAYRLPHLPLILAGPLLRRTEPDTVTVWIALKQPCEVELQVYFTNPDGTIQKHPLLIGRRSTIALGHHLHVVAVTARSEGGDRLHPGQLYAYDLTFWITGAAESIALSLHQALQAPQHDPVFISYFDHSFPTFCLPPADLNDLCLIQGSCRKLHGEGHDALPILDDLLAQTAAQPYRRPHQLFLTGDQIYGDDVADPLLAMMQDITQALFGWNEVIPEGISTAALRPGQRSACAEHQGGFTAGLHHKTEFASSHLFFFQEYCTLYLLSWSPVLWSMAFPRGREVSGRSREAKAWDKTVARLRDAHALLGKVRRALANIPTYMIFDDHDISDDWYLNQAWCLRVLGKPLGRQTVRNGLLAYALFQGWGNTPQQFDNGQPGEALLKATQDWVYRGGENHQAEVAIARLLGLPACDPHTGLPQMHRDGEVLVLKRDEQSLTWHYTVRGDRHEVIVLDTRTWRGYPAHEDPLAPPMLLSPTAFQRQLDQSLAQAPLNAATESSIEATFLVAPTNLITLQAVDWIQQWELRQNKVFNSDVGDAWNIHRAAFFQFLQTINQHRRQVMVLSGDIHYGSAVRITHWDAFKLDAPLQSPTNPPSHTVIQLTASALKNSEGKTQIVHSKVKSILPEGKRDWLGWSDLSLVVGMHELPGHVHHMTLGPPGQPSLWQRFWFRPSQNLLHRLITHLLRRHQIPSPPDWHYHIEWIPRQPSRTPPWGRRLPWLASRYPSRWSALKQAIALLWRNRWLQEGREVVGRNNMGVVRLDWSSTPEHRAVYQDLYWYATWERDRIVFSRSYAPFHPRHF